MQTRPGQHHDDRNIALAVDGGGMRGIVSGAMLSALRELGYGLSFDAVIGSSAGAINSAYFVSGDGWPALTVYYDELLSRDFIDIRRLASKSPVLSTEYVICDVMDTHYPLRYADVLSSSIQLGVIVTDIEMARPVVMQGFASRGELSRALLASIALPFIAGRPIQMDGRTFLDGSMSVAHPALALDGATYTDIVVIRTKSEPQTRRATMTRYATGAYLRSLNPNLAKRYSASLQDYAEFSRELALRQRTVWKGAEILDISCAPGSHTVARFARDRGALLQGVRAGYEAVASAMEGADPKVHLRASFAPTFSTDFARESGL